MWWDWFAVTAFSFVFSFGFSFLAFVALSFPFSFVFAFSLLLAFATTFCGRGLLASRPQRLCVHPFLEVGDLALLVFDSASGF